MWREDEGVKRRSASTSVIVAHFGSGRGAVFQVTPTRVRCVYAPLLTRHNSDTKSCPNLEGRQPKAAKSCPSITAQARISKWREDEQRQREGRPMRCRCCSSLGDSWRLFMHNTTVLGEHDGHKVILNGTPSLNLQQAFKFDDALVDDDAAWRWRWRWRWSQVPSGTSWLTAQKSH